MSASLWIETEPGPSYQPFHGRLEVDVAVVGGGIVGIATAHRLKEAGLRVAVLEADRILRGVTGHTTAKLTAGHGLVYTHLEQHFGEDGARRYAEANQWGIAEVERLSTELGIDSDFERRDNVIYTEDPDEVESVKQEVDAARRAGLEAEFVDSLDLPFPVAGAVRQPNEAQYHPRKLLLPLAERLDGDGSGVYESSRVVGIGGASPMTVRLEGGLVRAEHVVVATNMPVLNRGLHFARAFPKRHYAVAGPAERMPQEMYISTESSPRSIRTVPVGDERLLLVLGEMHAVGQADDTEERPGRVAKWAEERFGLREVRYTWSAQDYYSADRVPLIGPISWTSSRVLVATGFGGWGMSQGIAASRILADAVLGRENPWASLYSPRRLKKVAVPTLVEENAKVGARWIGDRVPLRDPSIEDLRPGEGAIVRAGGRRVAAYRDPDGRVQALSSRCTHLGCDVEWNGAEQSWDCPCHGSRFDTSGRVLNGPATDPLAPQDLDGA